MTAKMISKRKLEEHIAQTEAELANFDKTVLDAEGELQIYYRESLVKLKEVKELADVRLERLQESGEVAWEELRDDVDRAVERLRFNLNALMACFHDAAAEKTAVQHGPERKNKGTRKSKSTSRGKRH